MKNIQTKKQIAEQLVRDEISGTRKGSDKPNFQHSVNVGLFLEELGFEKNVVIAGILHDIIEDSNVSISGLQIKGFSPEVVNLVRLCTHDKSIKNKDSRWILMISKIIDRGSEKAMAIKMADLIDNIHSCHTLSPDRMIFMRDIKSQILLALTADDSYFDTISEKLRDAVRKQKR